MLECLLMLLQPPSALAACAHSLHGRDCLHPTSGSPVDSVGPCLSSPTPNTILVTEGRGWAGSRAQEPTQCPERRCTHLVTVVFIKGFLIVLGFLHMFFHKAQMKLVLLHTILQMWELSPRKQRSLVQDAPEGV